MKRLSLKELIKEKLNSGMTQYELADLVGISQGSIQKYLSTNTVPTLETLKKFANAFNIPLNSFIGNGIELSNTNDEMLNEIMVLASRLPNTKKKLVIEMIKGLLD